MTATIRTFQQGNEGLSEPNDHVCWKRPCIVCLLKAREPIPDEWLIPSSGERRARTLVLPDTPLRRRADAGSFQVQADNSNARIRAAREKFADLSPVAREAVLDLIDHLSSARHKRSLSVLRRLRIVPPAVAIGGAVAAFFKLAI